jgi:predicted transcriptional regulator
MNLQTEKLDILQTIINTDDAGLIKDVQAILKSRAYDWFDELSDKQQEDVLEGIAQLDKGQTFSHEEAKKRFGIQ